MARFISKIGWGFCFALTFTMISCAPSVPNDPGTPNALLTSPDTIVLTQPVPTGNSTLSLQCGCEFDYSVTNAGDTSKITFKVPKSQTLSSYVVTAAALPGLPSGTYTSWISFSAPDADVNNVTHIFYDTLHATITIP